MITVWKQEEATEKHKYIGNMRIIVKHKFTRRSENIKNDDHFNDSSLLSQLFSNHTIKIGIEDILKAAMALEYRIGTLYEKLISQH